MATQYSCLENSMDRGGWWAAAMGSQKVGHDWTHMVIIHTTFNRRWGVRSVTGGHWHKPCDIPRNCRPRAGPGALWSQQTLQEDSPLGTFLGTVRTLSPCLVVPRQCFLVFKKAYLVGFYFPPFVLTQKYATSHTLCQLAEFNHNPHTGLPLRPRQSCILWKVFQCQPWSIPLPSDHWALSFGPSLFWCLLLASDFSQAHVFSLRELVSCLRADPFSLVSGVISIMGIC